MDLHRRHRNRHQEQQHLHQIHPHRMLHLNNALIPLGALLRIHSAEDARHAHPVERHEAVPGQQEDDVDGDAEAGEPVQAGDDDEDERGQPRGGADDGGVHPARVVVLVLVVRADEVRGVEADDGEGEAELYEADEGGVDLIELAGGWGATAAVVADCLGGGFDGGFPEAEHVCEICC